MNIKHLLENNQRWVEQQVSEDPEFFHDLATVHAPKYLWIGCSDARVAANQLVDLKPGELFVHRNVANLVAPNDMNLLSVVQYAVEVLKVEHIIICGHYDCGGVKASLTNQQFGLVDNWLRCLRDISHKHKTELEIIADPAERANRLSELNVMTQVRNICHTSIVQNAWVAGQPLVVHGWVYDVGCGLLKDLDCNASDPKQLEDIYLLTE